MGFIESLSIRYKFGVIPFLFVLLFALSLYVIYSGQNQQKADAEIVNVAGRQRMLSQKIAFLAERLSAGHTEVRDELASTIQLCDQSLLVLQRGGVAKGMSGMRIPAAPDVLSSQLSEVASLWDSYKASA